MDAISDNQAYVHMWFEYNWYIMDTVDDILYIYIHLYIFIHTLNGNFILLTF